MMVHAGLPEPYWQYATEYTCHVADVIPNQTAEGFAREAYYKWYESTFDYGKMRTFGSRIYVSYHRINNMMNKAEEGILVGF